MPITKQQSDVPGVSEQEARQEAQAAEDEKRAKQDAAAQAGNIPQASSAALHNYPDAAYPIEGQSQEPGVQQPRTGAAATAKEE